MASKKSAKKPPAFPPDIEDKGEQAREFYNWLHDTFGTRPHAHAGGVMLSEIDPDEMVDLWKQELMKTRTPEPQPTTKYTWSEPSSAGIVVYPAEKKFWQTTRTALLETCRLWTRILCWHHDLDKTPMEENAKKSSFLSDKFYFYGPEHLARAKKAGERWHASGEYPEENELCIREGTRTT